MVANCPENPESRCTRYLCARPMDTRIYIRNLPRFEISRKGRRGELDPVIIMMGRKRTTHGVQVVLLHTLPVAHTSDVQSAIHGGYRLSDL